MIDIIINFSIFLVTTILLLFLWLRTRKDTPRKFRESFRYFTCLSNILCSVSALIFAMARFTGAVSDLSWTLKYIGTAAVTVTMLTVFLFLAPSVGKEWYHVLLKGPFNLFMHLLTPVMSLISFCGFERRGMTFLQSLFGMLPVVLYGLLYLYKIIYASEPERWNDFYGFNKDGKWPLMFAVMLSGTFAICMGLMSIQNL